MSYMKRRSQAQSRKSAHRIDGKVAPVALDALDVQLINCLRDNGRRSNRDMARQLGVAEATVRNRLRRLINEKCIQVVATLNPLKLGYQVDAVIGIEISNGRVEAVAEELAKMDEIRYVSITVGPYDMIIGAFFPSHADLYEFLTAKIGRIPWIKRTWTSLSLKLVKRSHDWMSTNGLRGIARGRRPVG